MKLRIVIEVDNVEDDLCESLAYYRNPDEWEKGDMCDEEDVYQLTPEELNKLLEEMHMASDFLVDCCYYDNMVEFEVLK